MYKFYLGKMADNTSDDYDNSDESFFLPSYYDDQPFDYESQKFRGKISAFALCKTSNRCALVDNHSKLNVFDIFDNTHVLQVIKSSQGKSPTPIKQISFITPNTLLALSQAGKLFIVAADQNQPIMFYKQRIKNSKGGKVIFDTIAVDPCHPYQIALYTTNKELIYWDLKLRILQPVLKNHTIDKLWYYNHSLGFKHRRKFTKYNLSVLQIENISSPQIEEYVSQTTVKQFCKKNKKKHNRRFVRPIGIGLSLAAGIIVGCYAIKKFEFHNSFIEYPCIVLSGILSSLNYFLNKYRNNC